MPINATNAVINGDMIVLSPNDLIQYTATEDCYLFMNNIYIEMSTGKSWFRFPTNTNVQVKEGEVVYIRSLDSQNTHMINIIDQTYNAPTIAGEVGIFVKLNDEDNKGYTVTTLSRTEETHEPILENSLEIVTNTFSDRILTGDDVTILVGSRMKNGFSIGNDISHFNQGEIGFSNIIIGENIITGSQEANALYGTSIIGTNIYSMLSLTNSINGNNIGPGFSVHAENMTVDTNNKTVTFFVEDISILMLMSGNNGANILLNMTGDSQKYNSNYYGRTSANVSTGEVILELDSSDPDRVADLNALSTALNEPGVDYNIIATIVAYGGDSVCNNIVADTCGFSKLKGASVIGYSSNIYDAEGSSFVISETLIAGTELSNIIAEDSLISSVANSSINDQGSVINSTVNLNSNSRHSIINARTFLVTGVEEDPAKLHIYDYHNDLNEGDSVILEMTVGDEKEYAYIILGSISEGSTAKIRVAEIASHTGDINGMRYEDKVQFLYKPNMDPNDAGAVVGNLSISGYYNSVLNTNDDPDRDRMNLSVLGNNNFVNGDTISVIGSNNIVGQEGTMLSVHGDNNVVNNQSQVFGNDNFVFSDHGNWDKIGFCSVNGNANILSQTHGDVVKGSYNSLAGRMYEIIDTDNISETEMEITLTPFSFNLLKEEHSLNDGRQIVFSRFSGNREKIDSVIHIITHVNDAENKIKLSYNWNQADYVEAGSWYIYSSNDPTSFLNEVSGVYNKMNLAFLSSINGFQNTATHSISSSSNGWMNKHSGMMVNQFGGGNFDYGMIVNNVGFANLNIGLKWGTDLNLTMDDINIISYDEVSATEFKCVLNSTNNNLEDISDTLFIIGVDSHGNYLATSYEAIVLSVTEKSATEMEIAGRYILPMGQHSQGLTFKYVVPVNKNGNGNIETYENLDGLFTTGGNNQSIGEYIYTTGHNNKSVGSDIFSFGSGNVITGAGLFNFGAFNQINADASGVIGANNIVNNSGMTVMGAGLNSYHDSSFLTGTYNSSYEDTDLYIVGGGANDAARANSMIITRSGDVKAPSCVVSDINPIERPDVLVPVSYLFSTEFGNALPTTDPGEPGKLWNDAGSLKISV